MGEANSVYQNQGQASREFWQGILRIVGFTYPYDTLRRVLLLQKHIRIEIQLMDLIIYSHYKSSNLWGWWIIIKIFEPLQRILEFQNSILRSHQNRWSALLVSTSFRWIVMFFSGCIFFYNVHLLKSSSWLTQCCLKNKDQRKVQLLTYTAHNPIKA